jgi:hypothetical protein
MHSPVSAFNDAFDTRGPIATAKGGENTILDGKGFWVIVVIREVWHELVVPAIPKAEQVLIADKATVVL